MVFTHPYSPHSYSPLQQKMVGLTSIPQWLEVLLGEKFFKPCFVHETDKKNEKNVFCLDCCVSLCPQCLHAHPSHRLIQIRRYVYQDVIRLNDAQKLMDCSSVQAYITNNAKVLFLNQRPMSRQFKGPGNACIVCDRNLQYPSLFCSIACKAIKMGSNKLELNVAKIENSVELENALMTPDSVLEIPVYESSSTSSSTASLPNLITRAAPLACAATTEFAKKKRNSIFVSRYRRQPAVADLIGAVIRRRKGTPHQSPLY